MPTKPFRFHQFSVLFAEGVGALHASFELLLNVTEEDISEGKKLLLSASMECNAAKAYGSGKVLPWCTVTNNIDHKKYVLDAKGKSFALGQSEILIGSVEFIIPFKRHRLPSLEVKAGYELDTGYTGLIKPVPGNTTNHIDLHKFN